MDRRAAAIMASLIIIPIAAQRVGAAGPISIVRVSACDAAGLAEAMAMILNGRPQGARFFTSIDHRLLSECSTPDASQAG